tara:strand:+ start:1495 stop:2109 length:615 start_codon:yes stop_codon:yes gene_type:complete
LQKSAISKPLIALLATVALTGACSGAAETNAVDADATSQDTRPSALLPPAPKPVACSADGLLSASLYGALEGEIRWQAEAMSCEGMPRPGGEGARLRFAGGAGDSGLALAFIVAIPGLEPGTRGTELPTRLTIIEEGKGRFFGSVDLDNCWTDVSNQLPADENEHASVVAGKVFCIAPLAEVNGDSSVSIKHFEFRGIVIWGPQ